MVTISSGRSSFDAVTSPIHLDSAGVERSPIGRYGALAMRSRRVARGKRGEPLPGLKAR